MFLGTFNPKLDDKGRLILPSKFRAEFASGLVITRGQERCLYVFTMQDFEQMHERIRSAPLASKQARDYMRVLLSGAHDEIPDKQNRVTIPPQLREYASLTRELAVIGSGARAEIWDAQLWQKYLAEQEQKFSEVAEEVIPGLF
ncbi:division/cell wall cluster transcriptional repressor MraZ [Canibacter sp. lx-72]|uniref:division/cell wall cluster transcriptional repressor MraZ n=1 Tax=Canibacter zhuwentaonis TaxID=2837491 RepID=UPI001BDBDCAF|nr:division/cell wall cluster transcriptional repressor MraZ [Canibacter zhuwentaonis]MBT1018240.1 division/cell wall cluster transcriptional repressor MraZ [Canibacter zhuwentaonis]MBT1035250.1 division/cell wall cluster transcriptional repressor MraZ [Canibacter zhuwentaonis]